MGLVSVANSGTRCFVYYSCLFQGAFGSFPSLQPLVVREFFFAWRILTKPFIGVALQEFRSLGCSFTHFVTRRF